MQEEYKFNVACSIAELYQEQFFDLFSPKKRDMAAVDIREIQNHIVMTGLTELEVNSAREVTGHLMHGSAGRAMKSIATNETSSRSHAIFTLTVVFSKLESPQFCGIPFSHSSIAIFRKDLHLAALRGANAYYYGQS